MARPSLHYIARSLNDRSGNKGRPNHLSSKGSRMNPLSCVQIKERHHQTRVETLETANFFLMNILGEKSLVKKMKEVAASEGDLEIRNYLLRFISEEEEHSRWFESFLTTHVGNLQEELVQGLHLSKAVGNSPHEFMLLVCLFEEMVCSINQEVAAHPETHPEVASLHKAHFEDEVRHLAFDRSWLHERLEVSGLETLLQRGAAFIDAFWVDYANPAIYRLAGLKDSGNVHMNMVCSEAFENYKIKHSLRARRFLDILRAKIKERAA